MLIRNFFCFFLCTSLFVPAAEIFTCGEKKNVTRPYGTVQIRVDCELTEGRMWVAEFKSEDVHGFSQGFDIATGKRTDSCFYLNGKKDGLSLVWDSLGNVIGRYKYRNGKSVGKRESHYSFGRPALIKHYNNNGQADGPWNEWWKNGNKKNEMIAKNNQITSGIEYYETGKPRIKYLAKYEPKGATLFAIRKYAMEAWAPDGRPAGKVVNGNGEILVFPEERDKNAPVIFHETYKDSLVAKVVKLDTVAAKKWVDSLSRSQAKKP